MNASAECTRTPIEKKILDNWVLSGHTFRGDPLVSELGISTIQHRRERLRTKAKEFPK